MNKDCAREMREAVIKEHDRLVAQEWADDPIKASFLPRGYYARKISKNPTFSRYSEGYIYRIIKERWNNPN